jgi:hypothetical protein
LVSIKALFKENFVLAVGIGLPVVLVLLFFLAMVLPNRLVAPPQYNFLFTLDDYQRNGPPSVSVRYDVSKATLRATLFVDDKQNYSAIPRLFIFEAATQNPREIAVDLPAGPEAIPEDRLLRVDEVAGLHIDPRLTAPDGYEFRSAEYYNRGLFTELFINGRSRYQPSLVKQGAHIRINLPAGQYGYYNLRFLGWVIPRQ